MSERTGIHDCIVLRSRDIPSGNGVATLLSAEAGILDVFVFGGPKSRLRSRASPYSEGLARVYHDPVRDMRKLTDFEVRECNAGLRDNLGRLWRAGLVAEILMLTSGGGGDFAYVRRLAAATLAALSTAGDRDLDPPPILFVWRLLAVLGLRPETGECAACGRVIVPVHDGNVAARRQAGTGGMPAYSAVREGFLCAPCAGAETTGTATEHEAVPPDRRSILNVTAGGLRWLEMSDRSEFGAAISVGLDRSSLDSLRILSFALLRRAIDAPIRHLDLGLPS